MAQRKLFLVTGATGTQGGSVARALLAAGERTRILTRNPVAAAAEELARRGAEVAQGDMEEPASLVAAMAGVDGVFSVQRPDATGTDSERRHGFALIKAARAAGVHQFVHSSVCQVDQHTSFPRWDERYWSVKYWTDKWEVEQAVRSAGFAHWTLLRPSFIMENFTYPKAQFLFPQLRQGMIVTPVRPNARVQLIAGDDIGAFARAAFTDPVRFDAKAIELAGDDLTVGEIASMLGRVLGKKVHAESVTPQEAIEAGIVATWVRSQEWINEVGYHVDVGQLPPYGVSLTSFGQWVKRYANRIIIGQ